MTRGVSFLLGLTIEALMDCSMTTLYYTMVWLTTRYYWYDQVNRVPSIQPWI